MAGITTKILIAEDDIFLSGIMTRLLEEEGFITEKASNGDEALAKIKANKYAAVLLDLIMPKRNGFEVLEGLSEEEKKTPILVFSNIAQETDKEKAFSLGAKGYYIKSNIPINTIVEAVKEALKKK